MRLRRPGNAHPPAVLLTDETALACIQWQRGKGVPVGCSAIPAGRGLEVHTNTIKNQFEPVVRLSGAC